jgi:hypothetical protein
MRFINRFAIIRAAVAGLRNRHRVLLVSQNGRRDSGARGSNVSRTRGHGSGSIEFHHNHYDGQ